LTSKKSSYNKNIL